jgi:DNA replication protein DnaC
MKEVNNFMKRWPEEEPFFYTKVLSLFPYIVGKALQKLPFPKELEKGIGEGQYIWGPNGTGKTVYAAFMLVSEIKSEFDLKNNIFISSVELLSKFRSSYVKNSSESEIEILDRYSKANILVLDDFGVEKSTEWAYQMLYLLINRRYENMLTTIFTSNLTLGELGEKLGDNRIPSRIQGMSKIINMAGNDFRAERL